MKRIQINENDLLLTGSIPHQFPISNRIVTLYKFHRPAISRLNMLNRHLIDLVSCSRKLQGQEAVREVIL